MTPVASRQRLTVRAARARVALAADGVIEVIRTPRITRVPHGPPGLLGVTHLRGAVLPVLALDALLGEKDLGEATRVVVLRREPPIGLAVGSIEALGRVGAADDLPPLGQFMVSDADGDRLFDLDAVLRERFAGFRATARSPAAEAAPGAAPFRGQDLSFLGFTLAGQAYALPLDAVAEVIAAPQAVTALPSTEAVLIGVIELRGAVVPLVSLRALLGLPARSVQTDDRVVVIRTGGQCLALLVDRVTRVLRAAPDSVSPAPSLFNSGAGEARIDAVLRLGEGRGLVPILSASAVLADDRIAQQLAETQVANGVTAMAVRRPHLRFLLIELGEETYGLPLSAVDAVVRPPRTLTRLPGAPDYVRGVMNLRGRVIPVIDQRLRFKAAREAGAEASGASRHAVIVTVGQLQAAFAVDAANRILEIAGEDVMGSPELSADGDRLFDRAVKLERDGGVILLIDPSVMLRRADRDLLRDLTAKTPAP